MKATNGRDFLLMNALRAMTVIGIVITVPGLGQAARNVTLSQALDLAATHSPVLKASRQEVKVADAERAIAGAAYYPKLEASEAWTHTNKPSMVFGDLLNQGRFTQADFDITSLNNPGSLENFRSVISLVQPVYNGGREGIGVVVAEIGRAVAGEALENSGQRVFFTVTQAFYDLLLAKSTFGIARETVQVAERDVKTIRSRYEGGTTVKSDLLQAEVRLATHREAVIRAEQSVRVAGIALRHGIGLDEPVDATTVLSVSKGDIPNLHVTVGRALESRHDYRRLAAELEQADTKIRLAKSAYLPTFNLQASYEVNNTAPFSENGSNNYVALGVLTMNLFNGFSDAAGVRKAKAQAERIRNLLAAKRRSIEVEAAEAYYGWRAARERLNVTERVVTQAKESLRIIRNRYEAGIAPVIDLLTGELVLNEAKQNRIRAIYDERIGQARLAFVTGQLNQAPQ
ncbi:MAG: TolC family protein [Nitrospirales bacterium]